MRHYYWKLLVTLGCVYITLLTAGLAHSQTRIFFLHHSTGRYLIYQGSVRDSISAYSASADVDCVFWDHDYNSIGLKNTDGTSLGYSFNIPNDNTDPDGLYNLWTTANAARDSILNRFDIITFKSCYPACAINSDSQLADYKSWYLEMLNVFALYPQKKFVIMSPPPLHRLSGTNSDEATRARDFANWLGSEYLAGQSNILYFNFFNLLAHPNDGSAYCNMLKYEYERNHSANDSHPNYTANAEVGAVFAKFLVDVVVDLVPVESINMGDVKAMYRHP